MIDRRNVMPRHDRKKKIPCKEKLCNGPSLIRIKKGVEQFHKLIYMDAKLIYFWNTLVWTQPPFLKPFTRPSKDSSQIACQRDFLNDRKKLNTACHNYKCMFSLKSICVNL